MATEIEKTAETGQEMAPAATTSVGAILREERERQGISLEDVARKTNIRLNYLDSIEQDRFNAVPGDVFVRGIIRRYGNFLGLDGLDLVRQYRASHAVEGESQTHALPVRESHNVHIRPSFKSNRETGSGLGTNHKAWWLALLLVAALALAAGLYVYSGGRQALSGPRSFLPSFLSGRAATQENKAPAAPRADRDGDAAARVPAEAEKTTLEIRVVREKCWLEVTEEGGRVLYSGTLTKGQHQSFASTKSLTLVMGYPPALEIVHNGVKLPAIPHPGTVERTFGPAK